MHLDCNTLLIFELKHKSSSQCASTSKADVGSKADVCVDDDLEKTNGIITFMCHCNQRECTKGFVLG